MTELCAYSKVQSAATSNRVAEMLRPRHHSTYYKSLDHQNHSKTVLNVALTSMDGTLAQCLQTRVDPAAYSVAKQFT